MSYGMTYRIIAQEMLRSAFGQDYGLSSDTVLEKTPGIVLLLKVSLVMVSTTVMR